MNTTYNYKVPDSSNKLQEENHEPNKFSQEKLNSEQRPKGLLEAHQGIPKKNFQIKKNMSLNKIHKTFYQSIGI